MSRLAMEWFSSYLTGRLISTKVDQVRSAIRPTFSGVPQGSVLGPLLFLLFNGDLPSAVKCNSALFADDTMISATGCMPSTQPCCGVSAGVEECRRWASRNNSGFNANKSAELFITFARQKAVSTPLLTLGNATIPRVTCQKHLGIVIDQHLSWSNHVDMLVKKVQPKIFLLMCLAYRASLSAFALTKFYTGLIRPHLEYCSSVWLNCGKGASDRLERIQLRAARYILRHRRRESNHSERLQALNLSTLAWRRHAHQLAMQWKLVNGHGPPRLLKELPQMCKDRCNNNLTRPLNFEVPLSHTSVFCLALSSYHLALSGINFHLMFSSVLV